MIGASTGGGLRAVRRRGTRALVVLALAAIASGCSPEAARTRGDGLGADVGNARLPIEMHGNQARNNPSFGVPQPGRAPQDARGDRAWWRRD